MHQVFFPMLPHYFTMYIVFRVILPRHSWSLYGGLSFDFPSGTVVLRPNILWSTPPIQESMIDSTLVVSPPMPEIICVWAVMVWVECFNTVLVTKAVNRHDKMCKQMHRSTHKSKVPGRVSFCHGAKFQYLNRSWFLIFLELCLREAGSSLLAWSPSSTESGLVNPVNSGSTSLHCSDGEWGVSSSWLSVRPLASNASSSCDAGVVSLLPSPFTAFPHSPYVYYYVYDAMPPSAERGQLFYGPT